MPNLEQMIIFGNIRFGSHFSTFFHLTSWKKAETSNGRFVRYRGKGRFWAQKYPKMPNLGQMRIFGNIRGGSSLSIYFYLTSCKKTEKTN